MFKNKERQAISRIIRSESIGSSTGGNSFEAPTELVGPITEIRIWHGSEIDAIQVMYGTLISDKVGGTGGGSGGVADVKNVGYSILDIPQNKDIVAIEALTTDSKFNKGKLKGLKFKLLNKENGSPSWSEWFGKGENDSNKKTISFDNFPLRSISGRANRKIDQLIFNFGNPFKINNLKIQVPSQIDILTDENTKLKSIDQGSYSNPSDLPEVGNSIELSKDNTDKITFNFNSSTEFTAGMKISSSVNFGVKGIASGSISSEWSFSLKQSLSVGKSNESTESRGRKINEKFTAEPNSITHWKLVVLEYELKDLTFTYDLVFYNEQNEIQETVTMEGTLAGNITSTNYIFEKEIERISL